MAIYEFKCPKCGYKFDDFQSGVLHIPPCPKCGTATEKQISVGARPVIK